MTRNEDAMKLVVIGATGSVGSAFVNQALNRGHEVLAISRSGGGHSRAARLVADVLDTAALTDCLRGWDAVFSATDGNIEKPGPAMASLVAAAGNASVPRVVAIGGAGVLNVENGDLLFQTNSFPNFLRAASESQLEALEHLEASRIEWTLLCPGAMVEGAPTGLYRHQAEFALADGNQIRFADVAHLGLECLEDSFYLRQKVAIAY